jgi:hypothetical protein
MTGELDRGALAPWAGLFLGAAAWFGQHQTASDIIYWDCRLGGPLLTAGTALVAALVTAAGGWISWRAHAARRGAVEPPAHNRSVSGMIGAGSAGVFLLAIAFQGLAGVIVPVCHR